MKRILLLFIFILNVINGYRILIVYPTPLYSHQQVPQAVIKGLLTAGHEIVFVTPFDVAFHHPNLEVINVGKTPKFVESTEWLSKTLNDEHPNSQKFREVWLKFEMMQVAGVLATESVQIVMNTDAFDAVIVENLMAIPLLALAVHFKCTSIGMSSMETLPVIYRNLGAPAHYVFDPPPTEKVSIHPNIFQRIKAFYLSLFDDIELHDFFSIVVDPQLKNMFPQNTLNSVELIRNVDLHIEAASSVWNPRPLTPNIVQIGLLHVEPPNFLPKELQNFLDSSVNGVIYVSFGSTFPGRTLDEKLIKTICDTLGSLPYGVIWKLEYEIPVPDNVKLVKWVPQQDLLDHENVKVFIAQGGFQSIEESISRGVPLVVIPLALDQPYNGEKVQLYGLGKMIRKEKVTRERLRNVIVEVVQNREYKENVIKFRDLILDSTKTPIQTAVWWIEYAIRNKGKVPKYHASDTPLYQYFGLDIFVAHLTVAILLICCTRRLLSRKNLE